MILLSLLLTLTPQNVMADVSSYQEVMKLIQSCSPQVEKTLNQSQSRHIWHHQAPLHKKSKIFRSPTDEWGRWIELSVNQWGQPTVIVLSNQSRLKIQWTSDCRTQNNEESGLDFNKLHPDSKANWITDEKLLKIIQNKTGIIYVWSPQMIYSAKMYKKFQSVAKQLNIQFIPVGDPRSSIELMKKSSQNFEFSLNKQKLNSVELYMRNSMTHYPSVVVFKNGKLLDNLIVGVMEPEELKLKIQSQIY